MTRAGLTHRRILRVDAKAARSDALEDTLAVEEPLEIRVSGETLAVTMRTPGNDPELALGFLLSEGLIRTRLDIGSVAHCGRPDEEGHGNTLEVTPAAGVIIELEKTSRTRRGTLTTAACGVCGRRSVQDLVSLCGRVRSPSPPLPHSLITLAQQALSSRQPLFAHTGGVHAALAMDAGGKVLAIHEDVGRHNAVDKVVGRLLMDGHLEPAPGRREAPASAVAILAVSGRASFEIIQKAAVASIPLVASVSAPSSLAVELAEQVGICLAGFVRGERFNLYTHRDHLHLP